MACVLHWIEAHPGTAAWVQAVGTLIALAIAIAIPVWQAQREARDHRKGVSDSLLAMAAVATRILTAVQHDVKEFDELGMREGKWWVVEMSDDAYERYINCLLQIPLHSMPDDETVRALIDITESAQKCRNLILAAAKPVNEKLEHVSSDRMEEIRKFTHLLALSISRLNTHARRIVSR
jgi:hypothetical protein